ncbi:hypothetical protein CR161_00170 [Prosthecochloris sp. ZM]|uniref:outer membrane protein assembly factor BamD n=1 Tax=Prosthecochloris sp. ZM TaxID=2283143 RepID=UPI000DF7A0CB|nr:outer membrane protein assembly factor BamD [Prosthecochloris sp. ZM]RDD29248.1 hypothetical protein CR161_00170 [Prosthecochloris sp. ZM]
MVPVLRLMVNPRSVVAGICVASSLSFSACSSSKPPSEGDITSRYSYARQLVEKEKYDRAIIELESLMFASRATTMEDDVLFSLADSYYQSEQYLLAIEIYKRLLEQTPGSPYAPEAQFMLAKSHMELSPDYARDQEHTRKAIREFQLYLDLYPQRQDASDLADDIEVLKGLIQLNPDNAAYRSKLALALSESERLGRIQESQKNIALLREKLAENTFAIAERYVKLDQYRAAEVFYEDILRFYPDTPYFEKAWTGKIMALIKRGKWFEARAALEAYDRQFPENMENVEDYRNKIMKHFTNS